MLKYIKYIVNLVHKKFDLKFDQSTFVPLPLSRPRPLPLPLPRALETHGTGDTGGGGVIEGEGSGVDSGSESETHWTHSTHYYLSPTSVEVVSQSWVKMTNGYQ